jgi:hypothetical protein
MNYSLLAFGSLGVVLLLALIWLSISRRRSALEGNSSLRQERDWPHVSYLPQIKQALAQSDFEFLRARGFPGLVKRVRKERRSLGLNYLSALRTDFEKLQNFARLVTVMSPDVAVAQELQGLRLKVEFSCRYQVIYLRLLCGIAPSEAVSNLSNVLSALTVRMETAMQDLSERAALGAELSSPFNGRGMSIS